MYSWTVRRLFLMMLLHDIATQDLLYVVQYPYSVCTGFSRITEPFRFWMPPFLRAFRGELSIFWHQSQLSELRVYSAISHPELLTPLCSVRGSLQIVCFPFCDHRMILSSWRLRLKSVISNRLPSWLVMPYLSILPPPPGPELFDLSREMHQPHTTQWTTCVRVVKLIRTTPYVLGSGLR